MIYNKQDIEKEILNYKESYTNKWYILYPTILFVIVIVIVIIFLIKINFL